MGTDNEPDLLVSIEKWFFLGDGSPVSPSDISFRPNELSLDSYNPDRFSGSDTVSGMSLRGPFYGSSHEETAGTFEYFSGGAYDVGVFGAKKQYYSAYNK